MVDSKLTDFVAKKRQGGSSDESIRQLLIENKWHPEIVDEALGSSVPSPDAYFWSLGELFSASFKMFKERYFSLLLLIFVPGILSAIFAFIISFSIAGMTAVLLSSKSSPLPVIGIILLITVVSAVFEIWSSVALLTSLSSERKISFVDSFRRSWHKILPFFFVNLILGCIMLGGTVLFVIPGIIFSVWFSFANFIIVTDKEKGLNAILKSREYVRGHWWAVFGRYALIGVIYTAIYFLLNSATDQFIKTMPLLGIIIWAIFTFIGPVFMVCYLYQIFRNLRDIKGNINLKVSRGSKVAYILIGILGILSVIAIPAIGVMAAINPAKQIEKAKTAQINNDKAMISNAIERYYAENGAFPKSLNDLIPSDLKSLPVIDPGSCFIANISSDGEVVVSYEPVSTVMCNQVLQGNQ